MIEHALYTGWQIGVNIVSQAAPLLIAAFAALLSEYAGLLNIGIEGLMLMGAFSGISGIVLCENMYGGFAALIAASACGAAYAALMGYAVIKHTANIYILGLSLNLLLSGLISVISTGLFGNQSIISVPLHFIPAVASVQIVSFLLVLCIALVFFIVMRYTRIGLHLKVLGKDTAFLADSGVSVSCMKMVTLAVSGALAVLAGFLLSFKLGAFVSNQSAGKGWIALVLAYAGNGSVAGVSAAAVLFTFLENCITDAQIGLEHPALLIGLPFLLGLCIIIAQKIVVKLFRRICRLSTFCMRTD